MTLTRCVALPAGLCVLATVMVVAPGCSPRQSMAERDSGDIVEQTYREGARDAVLLIEEAERVHGYHGARYREYRPRRMREE